MEFPISTLSAWLKKKDEIEQKFESEMNKKRKKYRTAKYPEVEKALLTWFTYARSQNVAISGDILRQKARHFASALGILESDFECSSGWLERFKGRYKITIKQVCGESQSVDLNSTDMTEWQSKLENSLREYNEDQIYNADETGLFFKLMLDKTLHFKNMDCNGGKLSKDGLTVLVCANMSGNDKLPLLVIGKSKNLDVLKILKRYQPVILLTKRRG